MAETALLIVDMQRGFLDRGRPLFVAGGPAAVPGLRRVLEAFREAGLPVLHARREYRPDGSDVEPVRREAFVQSGGFLLPGTADVEIVPELAPGADEPVVVKRGWSAFTMTELVSLLLRAGVRRLVVGGVNTANCVRATVYDAVAYGFDVTVLSDGTGSWDGAAQRSNLRDMERMGVAVATSLEVVAALAEERP